jgi:hypothetical protein
MAEEKMIRLGQASRKLNVGHNTILDFLAKKGFTVENNPNAKLTADQFAMLSKEFASSASEKIEASILTIGNKHTENLTIQNEPSTHRKKTEEDDSVLIKNLGSKEIKGKEEVKQPEKVEREKAKLEGIKVLGKIDLDKKPKSAPKEEAPKKKEKEKEVIKNQPEPKVEPKENSITSYKFPEVKENIITPYKAPETIQTKPQKEVMVTPAQSYPVKEDILKNAQPPKDEVVIKDSHSTRNWFLAIISLILVCGGGYYAFYLYQKSPLASTPTNNNNTSTSQIERAKSIISPDSKILISITGKNQNSIVSAIKTEVSKSQPEKTIKEIILTESNGEIISKVKAEKILNTIGVNTPELFSRSISDDWMLGVYSGTGEQKSVFIITTNNFFQNTFAGLIQWEKTKRVYKEVFKVDL